ncbi:MULTISPECIES: ankyrin repeat domain-containing protein [unclassified Acinetobacter]|uniref:ankyrin repeat domain-containing protein n=1 Tax=unclassified Acinetobacter TaxID=196816 RepID=UPI0035B945B2
MMPTLEQQLLDAIQQLDSQKVADCIEKGANVNFLDAERGFPLTVLCDSLFDWWLILQQAYDDDMPLSDSVKQEKLSPYLQIFEQLIVAGATPHTWDSEEFYGPLWDAASAACLPIVQRLLDLNVNPNTLDDDGLPVLSSISDLWFECDYDEINWNEAYLEQQTTLQLLRQHGAKTTTEIKPS